MNKARIKMPTGSAPVNEINEYCHERIRQLHEDLEQRDCGNTEFIRGQISELRMLMDHVKHNQI